MHGAVLNYRPTIVRFCGRDGHREVDGRISVKSVVFRNLKLSKV